MKYANRVLHLDGRERNAFVCAKTYKRMLELLEEFRISKSFFDAYWSKHGNDKMKEIAKDEEGIWIASDIQSEDYSKFTQKGRSK